MEVPTVYMIEKRTNGVSRLMLLPTAKYNANTGIALMMLPINIGMKGIVILNLEKFKLN